MKQMKSIACKCVPAAAGVILGCVVVLGASTVAEAAPRVEASLDVGPVWAGHRVRFSLMTVEGRQYVAFYDENRRMTVAMRTLDSDRWRYQKFDSTLGWDSHNYVTMAADAEGYVHLSGNMHVNPLVYFRTSRPHDAGSFERVAKMVGRQENRCTYPKFVEGANGELVFTYRDGGSGNGSRIYNVYEVKTKEWRRLLDQPLTDGKGRMNAYPVGPMRGPEDWFHICWVWRDTPDCSTNHDLSYARSRDLVHWETAAGTPVTLPMTIETEGVVVDAVPAAGGMINGNTKIGFDLRNRPVISYHKFDENGKTQVYNARFEDGRWRIRRASDWDYRWYFQGGGSIHFEIGVSPVVAREGVLVQDYRHDKRGSGTWRLDGETLEPIGVVSRASRLPGELGRARSDFPGMQVNWATDSGSSGRPGVRYVLRWETLGVNRDRPRQNAPAPSMLTVYRLRD